MDLLVLSDLLNGLPENLPSTDLKLVLMAVEARHAMNGYEAAINHRKDKGLSPERYAPLTEAYDRVAHVYETAITLLNSAQPNYAPKREDPGDPGMTWEKMISNAAAGLFNFDKLLRDATFGSTEAQGQSTKSNPED